MVVVFPLPGGLEHPVDPVTKLQPAGRRLKVDVARRQLPSRGQDLVDYFHGILGALRVKPREPLGNQVANRCRHARISLRSRRDSENQGNLLEPLLRFRHQGVFGRFAGRFVGY